MSGCAPAEPLGEAPGPIPLGDLAVRVAAYRWCEQRLFELSGTWAPQSTHHPVATVLLDRFSAEHAWHAQLWSERQPLPPHLSSLAGGPPPEPIGTYFHLLEDIGAAVDPGHRGPVVLGVLARSVLPRLVVTYRGHLARSNAVSAGPEMRVLRHVLADEIAEWQDAESAVQALVAHAPGAVREEIVAACGRLEEIVAPVGEGLLAWGPRQAQGAPGPGS